jgi:hypothetical protein
MAAATNIEPVKSAARSGTQGRPEGAHDGLVHYPSPLIGDGRLGCGELLMKVFISMPLHWIAPN